MISGESLANEWERKFREVESQRKVLSDFVTDFIYAFHDGDNGDEDLIHLCEYGKKLVEGEPYHHVYAWESKCRELETDNRELCRLLKKVLGTIHSLRMDMYDQDVRLLKMEIEKELERCGRF